MKLILILRSKNKQKSDSPWEEIWISGEIKNKTKAYKEFRSQKCKAFPSRNVSLRSHSVSFHPRSDPLHANRSVFLWCSSRLQGLYIPVDKGLEILLIRGVKSPDLAEASRKLIENSGIIKHAYKFVLREQVGFAAVLWHLRKSVSCFGFYQVASLNVV